jgi:hypothetical protein
MSERRNSFRIDESIALECKPVDEATAKAGHPELQFGNATSLKLYSELKKIDSDNIHLLHQIKELSRPLGEYLHNLNRKIELIGQQLMGEQKPQPPSKTIRQVNLSEGGIAFGSSTLLEPDQFVAIRMVFLPGNANLILFAKVIRCEPEQAGEYQVATHFYRINETQQQLVCQQIMRAQMAEKRRSHSIN